MSTDGFRWATEASGYLEPAPETDEQEATETENETGEPRQEHPVNEDDRNATYSTRSHNSTDERYSQRTDLRAVDEHASWREVSRACHCEPGR